MDFLTGLKELARMHTDPRSRCTTCPLRCTQDDETDEGSVAVFLSGMRDEEISRLVAKVEKWSAEHPVKTMEDVLFETFPAAKRLGNGCLRLCPDYIIPDWEPLCKNDNMRILGSEDCKKCWRRPVP